MNQSQSSTLIDPFHGDSLLSLFPRTFPDSNRTVKSNDLESIHQFMTSMAFQNPEKHFEEARSVVNGGAEFLNTKESEANVKENKQPRENRPALARKRARFSMKPNISQPSTIVEPTFQIDKLQNATPEEYFAAFEKFENAKKEMKRQRGEDVIEPIVPTTTRQRRPELPRRKVSYKHHTYSGQSQNDTQFSQNDTPFSQSDMPFSQETLQDNTESQPAHGSQQESITPNCQSKEEEIPRSISKSENNVNKLFDELLSSNIADLDGNEVSSYLQSCLNIKPIVADNLQIPSFHDIPRVDLSFSQDLLKDQTILHDPPALSYRLKEKTPRKQKKLIENSLSPLSSPTPSKSPFLAISTLGKLKSKSIEVESNDPFSPCDMELFPATTSSASKDKENSVSASKNKEISVSASKDKEISVSASKDKDTVLEPIRNIDVDEEDHDVTGSYVVTDLQTNEDMEANAEDIVSIPASVAEENLNGDDIPTDNPHSAQENVEDVTEKEVSSASPEELEKDCFQSDQTDDNSINEPDASRPVQVPETVPEQQNKVNPMTTKSKTKKTTKARKDDLRKSRQSLADAGTSWKAGVRRSNRITRRPLEYWRGERLLYGRVHNSLPTIIGVKYFSPSKEGFKVESFVADKYKDLVESMALH